MADIVGIAGTSASGKNTAAGHLESYGFMHVDTGEVVRAESLRLFGSTDQQFLRQAGHELRRRLGGGAVVLAAIADYREQSEDFAGLVVSGIRALAPAEAIKDNDGTLLFIDAPTERRYEQLVRRGRVGESKSLEEFKIFEEEELSGQLDTGQDLRGVQRISDISIFNASDIESFLIAVEEATGLSTSPSREIGSAAYLKSL